MAKKEKETFFNRISSEEISCIAGDAGFLGHGTFGVVRVGFYKNSAVAVKCVEISGSKRQHNSFEKR